ncbi:MAG: amino acid--tRNA ligase-related protein, partial [Spirochaetota bacterium]
MDLLAEILQKAETLKAVRHFLDSRNFIEVDTAILQTTVVPELHVHSLPCKGGFLLPSPELAMKALLCRCHLEHGSHSIYQLAHCFRDEAEQDALHFREFLMLELYGLDYSAVELLGLIDELLRVLPLSCLKGKELVVLSFAELCWRACGLEFDAYWRDGLPGMRELYVRAGGNRLQGLPTLNLDDLFHLFLVEFLEPYIARELPYCALYPYPDVTPLPAKCLDDIWVDRWELYLNGAELGNACREENRGEYLRRYRRRFEL